MDPQNMEYENSNSSETNKQQQPRMVIDEPSPIFKLIPAKEPSDSDCINKLLDYLSIDDLHSLGQTCKRVQESVGHFYQLRLSEHNFRHDCKYFGLRKYAKVLIASGKLRKVQWNQFVSVKRACFWLNHFADMRNMPKDMMSKIEHVAFDTAFKYKKYDQFFKEFCAQVKRLEIWDSNENDDWFTRNYPSLEHFAWYQSEKTNWLKRFFELNPAIRSFSTIASFCIANKSALKRLKLDDLYIFGSIEQAVCDRLNALHGGSVYKQLFITTDAYQDNINRLASLKSLVGLAMFDIIEEIDLSPLVHLKVLSFKTPPENIENIKNKTELAQSLEQLEEVRFWIAHVNDIAPFIHKSTKLKKVIVDKPLLDENEAIDLIAMNSEREKLLTHSRDVSKVTIYIAEPNYLATKWKTTETNLNLIEIQRRTSWDQVWFWHMGLF